MSFELFAPGRSAADEQGVPTLRILSGGRLVVNAEAQRMMGDVEFVQLFWDDETLQIGIMPSTGAEVDTFRLVRAPGQSIVTSQAFIDAYQPPLGKRMPLTWNGGMWVASTTDPQESRR